jgi:hypothetical protein
MSATVLSEVGAHTTNIAGVSVSKHPAYRLAGHLTAAQAAPPAARSGVGEGFESGSAGLAFEFAALVK